MNEFPPNQVDPPSEEEYQLRFSRTQSFFDKSFTIRLLIGVAFALCLFLFIHFRESYIDKLELGSLAKKYVVAQIDFSFPDEEATIILRQQATQEIGTIFKLKEGIIHQRTIDFQKYLSQFNEKDEEMSHRHFNSSELNLNKLSIDPLSLRVKTPLVLQGRTPQLNLEEIASTLALITEGLSFSRFTTAKTIQRIEKMPPEELPISSNYFYPYIPSQEKGRLPLQFWSHLEKILFADQKLSSDALSIVINYFEPLMWEFEVDQGMEYTLKKLAQGKILEKFSIVHAGERLIDKGEKVTTRHISMLQAMKDKLSQSRNLLDPLTILGTLLMTLLLLGVVIVYLRENHRDIFYSNRKLALLTTIAILSLVLAKVVELFLIKNTTNLIDLVRFPLFVPFAAILVCSLMYARIAAAATIFLTVVFAMALAVETIPFLVINILTGMVAILTARGIRRRKEIFIVCGKAWCASILVILSFNLYEGTALTLSMISDLTSTFLFITLTGIVVVGLLPILESIFQIMTDITLMEFMDPSNQFLRRLTIEAPGTYQHSLVVGHLAEAACSEIGANGLFCRVATQYHDIGKLANPQYFTENQLGGMNMHQLLTPLESAAVIIAHVSEGVSMARKVGLPEQFIDIIKEHHGTTLVYYFYHKQIEMTRGNNESINEKDFRYSGPKPRSKESTIIMIADSLEAASRSLDSFSEATISELVEELIAQKMEDGQFDESLLTFEELGIVKRALVKTLLAASHPRIKYPSHHPGEEG